MAIFYLSDPESDEECPTMASIETHMQRVTMSASNSRFLNLPGELRNKIYGFCVEAEPVPLRLRHEDEIKPVGKYRSFTQICRQIRAEFRLAYMAQTTFRLESTYHYARYIQSFYPPSDEATMLQYRGNIISLVNHDRDRTAGVTEFYDADIARVVLLVARSPNVRFTFELHRDLKKSNGTESVAQVNSMLALFSDPSNSKWRDMAKAIKEMRLRVRFIDSKLRIIMDQDMARKWKSTVFEMWNEAARPERGIRELRLAYADPNQESGSYRYRYQFEFEDSTDRTKSFSWQ